MTTIKSKRVVLALMTAFVCGVSVASDHDEHESDQRTHERGDKHKHRMEMMHARREAHMLEKIDANGDGNIDEAEFMADAKRRFEFLDADGDGVVTETERKEAGEKMREKHREAMKAAKKAYKEAKQ